VYGGVTYNFAATIANSYSIGAIGGSNGGGLIGWINPTGTTITNSYWDTQASGKLTSAGGVGVTTAQLKSGLPAGFDPSVWAISTSVNNGYPYLKWQTAPTPAAPVILTGSAPAVVDLQQSWQSFQLELGQAPDQLVKLNLQWQESKLGHILIDALAAAGGAKVPRVVGIGISDVPSVINAYITGGTLAGSSQLAGVIAVEAAEGAGGPLAAAGMQVAVDVGQIYVAPWLGNKMYDLAPSWFTPSATATALTASQFQVGAISTTQMGSVFITTNALSTPKSR
jgi:hypothetical protein